MSCFVVPGQASMPVLRSVSREPSTPGMTINGTRLRPVICVPDGGEGPVSWPAAWPTVMAARNRTAICAARRYTAMILLGRAQEVTIAAGRSPQAGAWRMNDIDTRLANRILWGLVLGAVAGSLTLFAGGFYPDLLAVARRFSVLVLDPLGQVFLRMLFFVVIPLVFASLAQGVAQLEGLAQLGPLATRTFTLCFP